MKKPMPVRPSQRQKKHPESLKAEMAILVLRAKLFRGEYRPGEQLQEATLASELSLPKRDIHGIFEQLTIEGLVEVSEAKHFVVRDFTDRDIYDVIELQSVLEGTAARFAAARVSHPSELRTIRTCHQKMVALINKHRSSPRFWAKPSPDLVSYSRLNGAFHNALVDMAKSPLLKSAVERIRTIPFASPMSVTIQAGSEDIPKIAMQQHGAIIDAIEKHQPELAERLARQHALMALRNVELNLENLKSSGKRRIPRIALVKAGA